MDTIRLLLEQSPLLAVFAAIGIGYALGQISIAGFSLGVGAVLFTGLALGAIAPKATPPGMVSSLGLIMFLYGIGIQYGKQFFAGMKGPGLKWNSHRRGRRDRRAGRRDRPRQDRRRFPRLRRGLVRGRAGQHADDASRD